LSLTPTPSFFPPLILSLPGWRAGSLVVSGHPGLEQPEKGAFALLAGCLATVGYQLRPDLPFGHARSSWAVRAEQPASLYQVGSGWHHHVPARFPVKISYGAGTALSGSGFLGQSTLRPDVSPGAIERLRKPVSRLGDVHTSCFQQPGLNTLD